MPAGNPRSSTDQAIPTIDLSVFRRPFRGDDDARRALMLERLTEACGVCGVFYVENHGVPGDVLMRAISHFDAFFDLPVEERMEIAIPPGEACGYQPLDETRELNDSFHCVFGMDEFPDLEALLHTGPNRWPRRPAGMEAAIREVVAALHGVGSDVMAALALSVGLPVDHFDPIIGSFHGSIRARRYPPQGNHRGKVGTNAHVDGLPMAFILQNDVPGLETEIPGTGWTAIEPRPGTIVCQLGSLFTRWTNGRYVPNRHRVINGDPTRERRSVILLVSDPP